MYVCERAYTGDYLPRAAGAAALGIMLKAATMWQRDMGDFGRSAPAAVQDSDPQAPAMQEEMQEQSPSSRKQGLEQFKKPIV